MKPSTIKILLIDDDEDDYVLTRDLLMDIHPSGYQLDWSHNPQTAIDSFKDNNYDLYLIDYKLGKMTGIDLIRLAREAVVPSPLLSSPVKAITRLILKRCSWVRRITW